MSANGIRYDTFSGTMNRPAHDPVTRPAAGSTQIRDNGPATDLGRPTATHTLDRRAIPAPWPVWWGWLPALVPHPRRARRPAVRGRRPGDLLLPQRCRERVRWSQIRGVSGRWCRPGWGCRPRRRRPGRSRRVFGLPKTVIRRRPGQCAVSRAVG
jgi:hypothetical protein